MQVYSYQAIPQQDDTSFRGLEERSLLVHLLLGGSVSLHVRLVALLLLEVLELEEVPLYGEQGDGGVGEQLRRDGAHLKAVLLQPEHLQPWTGAHPFRQQRNLILVEVEFRRLKFPNVVRHLGNPVV